MKIIQKVADVFRTDPKKNHLTGFSRGGFVTWRLLCKHADLSRRWPPRPPARRTDVERLHVRRRRHQQLSLRRLPGGKPRWRSRSCSSWVGPTSPSPRVYVADPRAGDRRLEPREQVTVDGDANYTHSRWTNANGTVLETFEHSYETEPSGPFGYAKGHCFPGKHHGSLRAAVRGPLQGPRRVHMG